MIRGDGPEESQAEIIDVSGDPGARSDAQLTAGLAADADRRPQPRLQAGDGRPVGPIGQRSSRAIAAAAGLVALLGLVAFAGFVNRGPALPLGTPPPVPGVQPLISRDPIFPGTAGGLPVLSVSTAQAIAADASGHDAELAVGGWYSAVRLVEACRPSIEPAGTCVSDWQAVLESRPEVRWSSDGTSHPIEPGTATITPVFVDPIASPALESGNPSGPLEVVPPGPVVLIGHFHDDRMCAASPGPSTLCTSAFVVDGVSDVQGKIASGPSPAEVASTRLTAAAIISVIRSHLQPAGFVLGYGALPWSADTSAPPWVEPSAAGPAADGRPVWLVRGYLALDAGTGVPGSGGAIASWMAIDDVTGQIWGPLAVPLALTPLGAEFPTTIDGLPVQSVSAAVPTGPSSSGLIAVGGYLSNDRSPEGCPPAPTTGKPNPCGDTQLVLIDDPASLLQPNDATFLYEIVVPPSLQSIRPVILAGTTVPDPWAGLSGLETRLTSRPVVLVGQFGDRRSPQCAARPGGGNPGCDRSFVIDQIAWIDSVPQGPSEYNGSALRPVHTRADVAAAVASWFLPGATPAIVSLTSTLPADAVQLTGVTLEGRAAVLFWVVHVVSSLPGGPTTTFLVFDDRTLNLVEVTAGD
jgi:hypothetical protein